jgi:hypothetical protein
MPLLHIAGLGGNNQKFSIAFSFTSDQSAQSYSWSLQTLHSLFTTHQIPLPKLSLTIHNPDLQNSLHQFFPNTHNLLSASHIYQDIKLNAKKIIKDNQTESKILELWSSLIKKPTPSEFHDFYHSNFKNNSGYPSKFIEFLDSTWIPLSHSFTNPWTKDLSHFDHRSLQIHVDHKYIKNTLLSKANNFPEISNTLSSELQHEEQIIRKEFSQKNIKTLRNINKIFSPCLGKISHAALKKAQVNFTQNSVKLACNNSYRKRMGIPCCHRLKEISTEDLKVQPEEFDPQWHYKVSFFFPSVFSFGGSFSLSLGGLSFLFSFSGGGLFIFLGGRGDYFWELEVVWRILDWKWSMVENWRRNAVDGRNIDHLCSPSPSPAAVGRWSKIGAEMQSMVEILTICAAPPPLLPLLVDGRKTGPKCSRWSKY